MVPYHIEVTSSEGASKWIRKIISHTEEQIKEAMDNSEIVTIIDEDGCETLVDMGDVFMVRLQSEEVYQRRAKQAAQNGDRGPRRS